MRDVYTDSASPALGPRPPIETEGEAWHAHGWAALLEWVYRRDGLELPRLELLKPEQVPQPYGTLLVHSADMTPTLEHFFRQPLGLTVLSSHLEGDSYWREVVLTLGREKRPILYGAIRIYLAHMTPRARQIVLEELLPLGRILQTEAIPHMSWPQAFFRARPDAHMAEKLRLSKASDLYGRRNVLVAGSRRLLAEVVEVLAPADSASEEPKRSPDLTPDHNTND